MQGRRGFKYTRETVGGPCPIASYYGTALRPPGRGGAGQQQQTAPPGRYCKCLVVRGRGECVRPGASLICLTAATAAARGVAAADTPKTARDELIS